MISGDVPNVLSAVNSGINFVWFTPDDSQNGHDTGVSYADSWFSGWSGSLLSAMSARRSLLIVTCDEDGELVYTCFASNASKKGLVSNNPYNHYSFAKLIESVWTGGTLGRNDASAADPSEGLA